MSGRTAIGFTVAVLACLAASSCGNLSNRAFEPGSIRVVLQLNPSSVGSFTSVDISWNATRTSDIPNPDPGIPLGNATASAQLSVARADQVLVIEFPVTDDLMRGFWSVTMTATGDGANVVNAACANQEVVSARIRRIVFSEGGANCTSGLE
jgi:hypothetical protein